MPNTPDRQATTIASPDTYIGKSQAIGGLENASNPPVVSVSGSGTMPSSVQPIGGTLNSASPPQSTLVGSSANSLLPPIVKTTSADSPSVDSFGRSRTSQSNSLLDSKFRFDKLPAIYQESTSSGTVTLSTLESRVRLANIFSTAANVLMRTWQYFLYRSGQSLLVMISFVSGSAVQDTRKLYGYFDDNNGLFFEVGTNPTAGTTGLFFVRRSGVSGAPVEYPVAQASWNLDTLDGSGDAGNPSGIQLLPDNVQILVFDLQFLGAGRVRAGFDIGGQIVYAHEFDNANVLSTVYMSTACLPISAQLITSVLTNTSMDLISAAVIREGSSLLEPFYQGTANSRNALPGPTQAVGNGIAASNTILAISLRSQFSQAFVYITGFEILNTTAAPVYYEVVLFRGTIPSYVPADFVAPNGDTCGTATKYSTKVYSGVGTAGEIPSASASGQFVLTSGYLASSAFKSDSIGSDRVSPGLLVMTGTDVVAIRAYGPTGAAAVYAAISFEEYY